MTNLIINIQTILSTTDVTNMTRRESTGEKTKSEILDFLFENEKPQHFKDIERNCSAARNTVKKYLEELKDEQVIEQSLKGRHPYFLTDKGRKYAETEFQKRELKQHIDELSAERIRSLYELVDRLVMKSVRLTVDKVVLEKMLQDFRRGKISEEKLDEIEEDYSRLGKELENHRFFSDEEIKRIAHTSMSREEIEKLSTARIKWFEKWFGD